MAGSGKSGLNLVRDQQDAMLITQRPQPAHQPGRGLVEPAFALNRFDDDSRDAPRVEVGLEQFCQGSK